MSGALDRARNLAPAMAARAAEIEQARRLPADIAAEMAAAGLFGITVPKSLGGSEVSAEEFVACVEALAQGDASVGWCLMIAGTTALSTAFLPHAVAAEIMAAPGTITGGVFAPMGKAVAEGAHYRVSGRWSWASGSANCQWILGGAMIFDDGKLRTFADGRPDHRMMVFPRAEVELIDTWHAAGLKGTGSGDFSVADVLVPKERSISLIADRPVEAGPLYKFPTFGLLALGIAGAASGNARAALEAVKALLVKRKPQGSQKSAAERATTQAEVAMAEARLLAARALLFESISACWEQALRQGEIDIEGRARLRLAATHMTRTAADITRIAYDLGGGSSVYLESSLQRRFRDAHAMTQHMMVAPPTYELAGRVLLGLPTDASTL